MSVMCRKASREEGSECGESERGKTVAAAKIKEDEREYKSKDNKKYKERCEQGEREER